MDSTLERLRRLQKLRTQRKAVEPSLLPPTDKPIPAQTETVASHFAQPLHGRVRKLETLIPGEEIETALGSLYVVTNRYGLDELRGSLSAADLLAHSPAALAALHPQFNLHESLHFANAAFIDTETTGLGGGAGIYAFMVGVGTYEKAEIGDWRLGDWGIHSSISQSPNPQSPISDLHYVVRQLFMRNPGEEAALLAFLAQLLADKSMTVTFNGRGFDLPLLRTRYFFNRGLVANGDMPAVLEKDGAHLDLLMPARRLWKRRLQSCRLINLEAQILGLQRSGDDVPGHLIPQLYVDYVNSNDARAMQGVFYHNHEDVRSMVGIATEIYRIASPTNEPMPQTLDGLDWLSLGQIYERQTQWEAAESAYRKALSAINEAAMLRAAFHLLGTMLKRLKRWQEATELWERWLTSLAGADATPYVELAKYHEWRSGDLEQAEMWVKWALHTVQSAPGQQRMAGQSAELEYRLARIQRKREK